MKSFLRENPTIAFGLGLPLLLVVLFLLISGVPTLLVASPQYDVLYATQYQDRLNGMQISVVDQKVRVVYQGSAHINQSPRLWRYNAETGAVKEIPIMLPAAAGQTRNSTAGPPEVPATLVIDVPELANLTIDSSSIAPDGYKFESGGDRYSNDVFGGLFYSSRYRNRAVLANSGRRIRLPDSGDRYYYHNTEFIGWIVSQ